MSDLSAVCPRSVNLQSVKRRSMNRQRLLWSAIFAACVLLGGPGRAKAEAEVDPGGSSPSYICWPLQDALEDLRSRGLKLIYSSDLVSNDLQVTEEPTGTAPEEMLDALLAPHGLRSQRGAGETWLVVRDGTMPSLSSKSTPRPVEVQDSSPLPDFVHVESPEWLALDFPMQGGALPEISSQVRYGVIRLRGDTWRAEDAFHLKEVIVTLRSFAPDLRVALEGTPGHLEAVVSPALAPYVDAYVYRETPFVPSTDPSARRWLRVETQGPRLLVHLRQAGRRGDELVIVEGPPIDAVHGAFLRRLQSTLSGDLETQPKVLGMEPERVRFFLNPSTGAYYLAIYARLGVTQDLSFFLPQAVEAESLFPRGASFDLLNMADGARLGLSGEYPYYLFALMPRHRSGVAQDLTVQSEIIIDPYEQVVKNQVFQERERHKFQSLDVMEYIHNTPQSTSGQRTGWEHRIIRRQGHLTEFHHLAFLRNGVRYPQRKLLKGRIFRSEALVALNPLEIELDRTYAYTYLGQDIVDGHATWKIGFEPIRKGSVGDGSLVSGIVWLDQLNHAHRRMRLFQKGLDNSLISQRSDYAYEWIPSNGQCFWDWRRRDSMIVQSFLGQQSATSQQTERTDFKFNRPDIDEVVRRSHQSDILIHVETPPEGHRWLVKNEGRRRLAHSASHWEPSAPNAELHSSHLEESGGVSEEGRELADVHAFSRRLFLAVDSFSVGEDVDLFPGLVFTDSDLFGKGYQAYAGFFQDDALFSLGIPNLFGNERRQSGLFLTTALRLPYEGDTRRGSEDVDGVFRTTDLDVREETLTWTLGAPLTRRGSLNVSYGLRRLSFDRTALSDDTLVLPTDTLEHLAGVELHWRWKRFSTRIEVEHGRREDWEPWGLASRLDVTEAFDTQDYILVTWNGGYFQPIGDHRSFATGLTYLKGEGLDRFSRLENGRTRAPVPGFSTTLQADEAIDLDLGYSFRAFRKMPMQVRMSWARLWLDDLGDDGEDFLGASLRFLVHGPWRLDIWPSVGYGIASSVDGAAGETVLGLSLGWRQ